MYVQRKQQEKKTPRGHLSSSTMTRISTAVFDVSVRIGFLSFLLTSPVTVVAFTTSKPKRTGRTIVSSSSPPRSASTALTMMPMTSKSTTVSFNNDDDFRQIHHPSMASLAVAQSRGGSNCSYSRNRRRTGPRMMLYVISSCLHSTTMTIGNNHNLEMYEGGYGYSINKVRLASPVPTPVFLASSFSSSEERSGGSGNNNKNSRNDDDDDDNNNDQDIKDKTDGDSAAAATSLQAHESDEVSLPSKVHSTLQRWVDEIPFGYLFRGKEGRDKLPPVLVEDNMVLFYDIFLIVNLSLSISFWVTHRLDVTYLPVAFNEGCFFSSLWILAGLYHGSFLYSSIDGHYDPMKEPEKAGPKAAAALAFNTYINAINLRLVAALIGAWVQHRQVGLLSIDGFSGEAMEQLIPLEMTCGLVLMPLWRSLHSSYTPRI